MGTLRPELPKKLIPFGRKSKGRGEAAGKNWPGSLNRPPPGITIAGVGTSPNVSGGPRRMLPGGFGFTALGGSGVYAVSIPQETWSKTPDPAAATTPTASNQGGAPSKRHRPQIAGTRRPVELRLIRSWVAPAPRPGRSPTHLISDHRSNGLDGFRFPPTETAARGARGQTPGAAGCWFLARGPQPGPPARRGRASNPFKASRSAGLTRW